MCDARANSAEPTAGKCGPGSGPLPDPEVCIEPGAQHEARHSSNEAVPPTADQEYREEDAGRGAYHQTHGRVAEPPVIHGMSLFRPYEGASPTDTPPLPVIGQERRQGHSSSLGLGDWIVTGAMSRRFRLTRPCQVWRPNVVLYQQHPSYSSMFDQWDDLLLSGGFAPRAVLLRALTLEQVGAVPEGAPHSIYQELWHLTKVLRMSLDE